MKKLQCVNCAGRIDGITLACQSCGMQYMIDDNFTLKCLNSNLKWATISGKVCVPAYVLKNMGEQAAAEMTLEMLAKSMATKIVPFMEFQSMFDPKYQSLDTICRLRVAEPVTDRFGNVQFQMPNIEWRFKE